MSERERASPRPSRLLAGLTAAHLVNDFYTMVIPPLLPALRVAFGLGYVTAGVLAWSFYILSGLLQPAVGQLADSRGRRRAVLVGGFLVFAVGFVAMALVPSYPMLLAARLLCGLGGTSYHPQSTGFLTKAFPATKGRAMGIHGWGGSIGNFLAPLVVTLLVARWGWRAALLGLAIPALVTAPLLFSLLDEPPPAAASSVTRGISRELVLVSVAFALLSMVLRGFVTFLPTFFVERGSTLAQAGVSTSLTLLVGLVAQPLGGQVYDRVGGRGIFFACSLAAGLGLIVSTAGGGTLLLVGAAMVAFAVYALFPVSLAMASEIATEARVGAGVGFMFGLSATLAAFTPILTGYVADRVGLGVAFQLLVLPAAGAAVLSACLPQRRPVTMAPAAADF